MIWLLGRAWKEDQNLLVSRLAQVAGPWEIMGSSRLSAEQGTEMFFYPFCWWESE